MVSHSTTALTGWLQPPYKDYDPLSCIISSKYFFDTIPMQDCKKWTQFYKDSVHQRAPHLDIFCSGSIAENLALRYPPSDTDLMMVSINKIFITEHLLLFPVSDKRACAHDAKYTFTRTSLHDTHPGYMMLLASLDMQTYGSWDEIQFASSKKLNQLWMDISQMPKDLSNDLLPRGEKVQEYGFGIHGPSVRRFFQTSSSAEPLEADIVQVLFYPGWPLEALEWVYRRRKSNWPPKFLVQSIVLNGCHVVPNGYPLSPRKDAEWRWSFSDAEIKLAHSVSKAQRVCYLIFKTLCKTNISSAVSTYHLKTTFFWLCEKIPKSHWRGSYIVRRLLDLLDALLIFVNNKYLPNYFIPKNNMIDHLDLATLRSIAKQIVKIRSDPLGKFLLYVEQFKDKNIQFEWLHKMTSHLTRKIDSGPPGLSEFYMFWTEVFLSCAEKGSTAQHNEKDMVENAYHFLKWACNSGFQESNIIKKTHLDNFIECLGYELASRGMRPVDVYSIDG